MSETSDYFFEPKDILFRETQDTKEMSHEETRLPDISEKALEALRRIAFPEDKIEELKKATGEFRYDRCEEKIERLIQRPLQAYFNKNTNIPCINLPHFFDIEGRKEGQCYDIASMWIIMVNDKKLLSDFKLPEGCSIAPVFFKGLGTPFFNTPGACHLWNGIRINENGKATTIMIDATMQQIFLEGEQDYTVDYEIVNPDSVKIEENLELHLNPLILDNGRFVGYYPRSFGVLGMIPADKQNSRRILEISFGRTDPFFNNIIPVLHTLDEDGDEFAYLPASHDTILVSAAASNKKHRSDPTSEIVRMLNNTKKFKIDYSSPKKRKYSWSRQYISSLF